MTAYDKRLDEVEKRAQQLNPEPAQYTAEQIEAFMLEPVKIREAARPGCCPLLAAFPYRSGCPCCPFTPPCSACPIRY